MGPAADSALEATDVTSVRYGHARQAVTHRRGRRLRDLSAILLLLDVYWLLFAGRWGSYVGIPGTQIYLNDLLIAASAMLLALARAGYVARSVRAVRSRWWGLVLAALLGWTALRLVVGPQFDLVALRDAAPYLYATVALLALANGAVDLVRPWHLAVALGLHDAWVLGVLRLHLDPSQAPRFGTVYAFTLRTDFDAAVCGVALIIGLHYAVTVRGRLPRGGWLALAATSGYLLLELDNRAAVVGTLAALVPVLVTTLRRAAVGWNWARGRRGRARAAVLGVVLVIGLGAVASQSATGGKIVSTVTGADQARGTVDARAAVYRKVLDYVTRTPTRTLVGVGFGQDYLHVTGADVIYEGTTFTGVRSPHNALLNTWARLGLLGVALQLLLLVGVAVAGLTALRAAGDPSSGLLLATVVVVIIPVTAMFGVILESPFGAVPYFLAVGGLLGRGAARPRVATSGRTAEHRER